MATSIYDKIVSIYAMLKYRMGEKASRFDLADAFSENKTYEPGRMVIYQDDLYVCTEAHAAREWDPDHFQAKTADEAIEYAVERVVEEKMVEYAKSSGIADEFDQGKYYSSGDLVMYKGELYKCTSNHVAGAWGDGADFSKLSVEDVIGACMKASDIADEFNDQTAYSEGDLVSYNGKLYRSVYGREAGPWYREDFYESTVSGALEYLAKKTDLADRFSESESYTKGDLVVHKNGLFVCKSDISRSEWSTSSSSFGRTTIGSALRESRKVVYLKTIDVNSISHHTVLENNSLTRIVIDSSFQYDIYEPLVEPPRVSRLIRLSEGIDGEIDFSSASAAIDTRAIDPESSVRIEVATSGTRYCHYFFDGKAPYNRIECPGGGITLIDFEFAGYNDNDPDEYEIWLVRFRHFCQ